MGHLEEALGGGAAVGALDPVVVDRRQGRQATGAEAVEVVVPEGEAAVAALHARGRADEEVDVGLDHLLQLPPLVVCEQGAAGRVGRIEQALAGGQQRSPVGNGRSSPGQPRQVGGRISTVWA